MLRASMQDFLIVFKGIILILFVHWVDVILSRISLLTIVPENAKQFFAETKEPLAWLVSFSVFILTLIKIKNEHKNRKNNDKK